MIISNSSPLILLAKINRLELLGKVYGKVHIPYEVYREVVIQGKKENYGNAAMIENHLGSIIFVENLNPTNKKKAEELKRVIGSGESEAIALCMQNKTNLLLMDNLEPRKIAQAQGLYCRSTPGILLDALKKKILTLNEYENAIKDLSRHAWLSGDVVAYFLENGRKKGDEK